MTRDEVREKLTATLQSAQERFRARIARPGMSQSRMWNQTDCENFTLDGIAFAFTMLAPEHEEVILAEVKRWKGGLEKVYMSVLREKQG